jgi:DNA polymerase I-like protein with 3'-5' exonuclease and polymerase domains
LSDLPSWKDVKRVGFDIETCDPHLYKLGPGVRRGGFIAGVSFAFDGGPQFYLPIRHQGGGNLNPDHVLDYLKDQTRVFTGDLVGAHLSYDLDYCAEEGIWFGNANICDIQVAEALIDELLDDYTLKSIGERRGLGGKAEDKLRAIAAAWSVDPKKDLWRLPSGAVGEYAEHDARLPLEILKSQEVDLAKADLFGIWDLERRVTPTLIKITRRGIPVDVDKLSEIESWTLDEERLSFAEIKHHTGIQIKVGDAMKAVVLAPALESLGIKLKRTKKGLYNIDKAVLEKIDHPVSEAAQRARRMSQLRTTFCKATRAHLTRSRMHCSYNQLRRDDEDGGTKGTRSGRLSATHTNLQQQPIRDPEIGPLWRSIYVPEFREVWGCCDFSQQEPRLTVHYAELSKLPMAKEAADQYRNDPSTDHHQMMSDLTGIERGTAKYIFLGLCYGMGGATMCRRYHLGPTKVIRRRGKFWTVAGDEGQAILDTFDQRLPFVRLLAKKCEKKARKTGFIRTLLGRLCRFPHDANGNFDWTYKALNRLIQGSAADQTKLAMVEAEDAGFEIRLQVHDEFDLSIEHPKQAEELAEIMKDCVKLKVPSKVDIEIGPNWGEIVKEKEWRKLYCD